MENPSRLEAIVQNLLGELDALKRIRDEMVKRGDQQINTWLENVSNREVYIDEIIKDLNERKSDLHLNDLSRGVKLTAERLKNKLIESVKVVKDLKERAVEMFLHGTAGDQPKRFSHDDLISFTSNFSKEIGSGGFGIVYRGRFPKDVQVAVKVLKQNRAIEEIFMIEVGTMLKASHPNLIKLYGFCFDCNMKALVYEFMEKGALNVVLLQNPCPVEWHTLYGIALEIAMALAYLHHDCDDRIIHHDVKPSNILLDSKFSPKVTDFGTARFMDSGVSHFTMTSVRGTCGYAAPEMIMHSSRVTYKCDVYSYGKLLFDILRIKSNTHEQVWRKFEKGELDETIKECFIMDNDIKRARILYLVAFWCIQFSENTRPSMKEVVNALEMKMKVAKPPNPFFSWEGNFSMQQSEDSPSADESMQVPISPDQCRALETSHPPRAYDADDDDEPGSPRQCIQFSENIKPSMKEVVNALEMKMKVAKPPNPFSSWEGYFSMQQSEDSPSADESEEEIPSSSMVGTCPLSSSHPGPEYEYPPLDPTRIRGLGCDTNQDINIMEPSMQVPISPHQWCQCHALETSHPPRAYDDYDVYEQTVHPPRKYNPHGSPEDSP